MALQTITPKIRRFICLNAHPTGCAWNVSEQISYVRKVFPPSNQNIRVLVIGASTGYGLASRIVSAFGFNAKTIGVFFEREPEGDKTGSAGHYNCVAFHRHASQAGLYAESINGDAFSDEIKKQVFDRIRSDLGEVDYVIYSLASPRRLHPKTGKIHHSVIKPIYSPFTGKSVDLCSAKIHHATIQSASEDEIADTQAVMGGEDWEFWIEGLLSEKLLSPGARTIAYSYIGPKQTWPIYHTGTIGKAKEHLEHAARKMNLKLQKAIGGHAWISINKAVVTQASAAIPVVPLYLAILYRLMRLKGLHEDCIEQISRLFVDHIGPGRSPHLDSNHCIRLDDLEMRDDIQGQIASTWEAFREGDEISEDVASYNADFQRLFGFGIREVDYSSPVETNLFYDKKREALVKIG